MLGVIVSGIVTGMLYALTGLGLVVTYRTTRVLNFALGGVGAVAGYVVYELTQDGVPYALAVVAAVAAGAGAGLLLSALVARPLRTAPPISIAIGTLGALLVVEGLLGAKYGYNALPLRQPVADPPGFHLGGVGIDLNQLIILAIGVGVSLLVAWLFQRTHVGLSMRAVSAGPGTSEMLGVNVAAMRALSWGLGGALGALAAVLVFPRTFLSPTGFTGFVIVTVVAVVIGGFTSIRGVIIGAVLYAVVLNLAQTYLWTGYPYTYSLICIAGILLFRPYGLFGGQEGSVSESRIPVRRSGLGGIRGGRRHELLAGGASNPLAQWLSGARLGSTRYLLLLAVLIVLPWLLSASNLLIAASTLVTFVAVLGLNVVSGYMGRVSLGQSAFLAVGGYTVAEMLAKTGIGAVGAVAAGTLIAAVLGVVLTLPIMRLSELYFVLVTVLFAAAVPELAVQLRSFSGGSNGMSVAAPPSLFAAVNQYWLALAVAGIAGTAILIAARTRIGRSWRAVRDSEPAARSLGTDPRVVKVVAFAIGSGLAGLSGGLSALFTGFVSPDSFGIFPSVYLLVAIVIGGRASVGGSLLGAAFITVVPEYTGGTSLPPDLIFGVIMLVMLMVSPNGLTGLLRRLARPAVEATRKATAEVVSEPALNSFDTTTHVSTATHRLRLTEDTSGLEVVDVVAGYGSGRVLDGISLSVQRGEMVAVLGANGVGKTTLLRVVSRVLTPDQGMVCWNREPIGAGRSSAHRAARMGICHVPEGRAIFPDLSVAENLAMGSRAKRGRATPNTDEAGDLERVLTLFPRLRERYRQAGGTLSGGEQQMLAIGRGLMGRPQLLLLDEPSLGLAPVITQQLFSSIAAIRDAGTSVLLVEQNAAAALRVVDRAYVMRAGRIHASGTRAELRAHDGLAASYLGGA